MSVVVIFGGTVEGRRICEALKMTGLTIHVCVATEYGADLLLEDCDTKVHVGRMDQEQIRNYLDETGPGMVIDATHPYAALVTENIAAACAALHVPVIRVVRRQEENGAGYQEKDMLFVDDVEEAVDYLQGSTGKIFITTGSKELAHFTRLSDYQDRCIARVLPVPSVIEGCSRLGFSGRNIIGMQGPFSEELNYCMLKQTGCRFLVTKDSGKEGGYQEKCKAAFRAGAKVIVIRRPKEEQAAFENSGNRVMELEEAVGFIKNYFGLKEKRRVYLIGTGPGAGELLTAQARNALMECDVIIGAGRILETCAGITQKPVFETYRKEEIAEFLNKNEGYEKAALVYSGDIGFYSGAKGIRELLAGYEIVPVSGISSPVYFLNKIGVPWEQVPLVSCHGQERSLIPVLLEKGKTCALLGRPAGAKEGEISQICKTLLEFGMEKARLTVGERLSYPEERILTGSPRELMGQRIDSLSILYMEYDDRRNHGIVPGIADEAFIRGKVPMTKQGVRVLSLSALKLRRDSVVFDVGAGTGSVSVEAALLCPEGKVFAIEKNPEAVALLDENRRKFGAENLKVVEGTAPECLKQLPAPSHVFIGGSGGRLIEIIKAAREKNVHVRFVINAITLETLAELEKIREAYPEYGEMNIMQVSLSACKVLSGYHMMKGENPVYIASFGGKCDE